MALEGRRVLFISYNGMLEPLGQTQVLPYLRALAKRGVRFTLLSFERARAFTPEGAAQCEQLRSELQAQGIEWHWLRYHKHPSVPATIYDVVAGIRKAKSLIRRNGIEMVHARSHIPATIALALKRSLGTTMWCTSRPSSPFHSRMMGQTRSVRVTTASVSAKMRRSAAFVRR